MSAASNIHCTIGTSLTEGGPFSWLQENGGLDPKLGQFVHMNPEQGFEGIDLWITDRSTFMDQDQKPPPTIVLSHRPPSNEERLHPLLTGVSCFIQKTDSFPRMKECFEVTSKTFLEDGLAQTSAHTPWIIVVEDEENHVYLIKKVFEQIGYVGELVFCQDGIQAMELLRERREHPPALIYLDVMLPRLNGIEIFLELRNKVYFQHCPMVLLSSLSSPLGIERVLDHGSVQWLTLPAFQEAAQASIQRSLHIWTRHVTLPSTL